MVDFTRQVAESTGKIQSVTPMKAPDDPTAQFVEAAVLGAAEGGAEAWKINKTNEALGEDLTSGQVASRVDEFEQNVEQFRNPTAGDMQLDLGTMSEDSLQAYGEGLVSKMDLDAKSVEKLVTAGKLSPIAGEAFLRQKLGAIQANPVAAIFSDKVSNAAGPRAGAGTGASGKIGGNAAAAKVAAQAKGQQEAIQEVEKQISVLTSKGIPRGVAMAQAQESAAIDMAKQDAANKQAIGLINFDETFSLNARDDYRQLNQLIGGNLNEKGLLDVGAIQGITADVQGRLRQRVMEVNSSNLSQADKDAKVSSLQKKAERDLAYVTSRGQSKYDEEYSDSLKNKSAREAYEMAPYITWATARGNDELAKQLANMNMEEKANRINELFGAGTAAGIVEMAEGLESFYDVTSQKPLDAVSVQGLAGEGAPQIVKDNAHNPEWRNRLGQVALDHPAETLYAINGSALERSARGGDEDAREVMVDTLSKSQASLLGALANFGGTVSVRPKLNRHGRPMAGLKIIDFPEGMSNKGQQLNQALQMFKNNMWAWPEGAESYEEAFTMWANGDGVADIGGDAEGGERTSGNLGRMAAARGKAGGPASSPKPSPVVPSIAAEASVDNLVGDLATAEVGQTVMIGSRPFFISSETRLNNLRSMFLEDDELTDPAEPSSTSPRTRRSIRDAGKQ